MDGRDVWDFDLSEVFISEVANMCHINVIRDLRRHRFLPIEDNHFSKRTTGTFAGKKCNPMTQVDQFLTEIPYYTLNTAVLYNRDYSFVCDQDVHLNLSGKESLDDISNHLAIGLASQSFVGLSHNTSHVLHA